MKIPFPYATDVDVTVNRSEHFDLHISMFLKMIHYNYDESGETAI